MYMDEKDDTEIDIGMRVRRLRERRGLTQHRLADLASVTPTVISNLENGKTMVGIYTLLQIVKALEITLDEILPEYSGVKDEELSDLLALNKCLSVYSAEKRAALIGSFIHMVKTAYEH